MDRPSDYDTKNYLWAAEVFRTIETEARAFPSPENVSVVEEARDVAKSYAAVNSLLLGANGKEQDVKVAAASIGKFVQASKIRPIGELGSKEPVPDPRARELLDKARALRIGRPGPVVTTPITGGSVDIGWKYSVPLDEPIPQGSVPRVRQALSDIANKAADAILVDYASTDVLKVSFQRIIGSEGPPINLGLPGQEIHLISESAPEIENTPAEVARLIRFQGANIFGIKVTGARRVPPPPEMIEKADRLEKEARMLLKQRLAGCIVENLSQ